MQNGKVKFYNREKKYGFVTSDEGKDYFFHNSAVSNEIYLKDGDRVEFRLVEGDRGLKAVDISPV